MKTKTIFLGAATLLSMLISEKATAQIGEPYIHDPYSIMELKENITLSAQAEAD